MRETWYECLFQSPVGDVRLISDGAALAGLYFPGHKDAAPFHRRVHHDESPFREAFDQLNAYFAGELQVFDLPLHMHGTPFQQLVWRELLNIPYGTTVSYSELARRIGRPNSTRAVGAANGQNPISIIAPCHRVIGADGSLTGYGGGLDRKEWLLEHEARTLRKAPSTNSEFRLVAR